MKTNSTNLIVTALGATVSSVGYGLMRRLRNNRIPAGVLGFGLAHVALGLLDMNRQEEESALATEDDFETEFEEWL